MGLQEQYKIIGQLKAIKKRLDLICEKMGIEALPLIKVDNEKETKQSKPVRYYDSQGKLVEAEPPRY